MNEYSSDPTVSKPIIEMLTIANEYCYFLENIENKEADDILNFFYRIAPLMYLKGSLLPEITVENPDANERFVTAEQWENLFNELRKKLGPQDEYWIIDPLYINENEPLKASLSENIADIYQDMKDFLMLYQKNTYAARENAVKECTRLFSNHWGYKITNSMSKVHHILHENKEEEENTYF